MKLLRLNEVPDPIELPPVAVVYHLELLPEQLATKLPVPPTQIDTPCYWCIFIR
jgi:hypothetical protein